LVASIVVHAIAFAILCFSLAYKPPVINISSNHYAVRQIDLSSALQPKPARAGQTRPNLHRNNVKPASSSQQHAPAMRQTAKLTPGPQTLIQPDLQQQADLTQQIPLPQVEEWSPSKTPAKKIVLPQSVQPAAAAVTPSLENPNQETNPADVDLAASDLLSAKLPVPAGTTSPVTDPFTQQSQLPPSMAAQFAAEATPAAILSASDLVLKDGTAVLPPVNQTAAANAQGDSLTGNASFYPSGKAGIGQGAGGNANDPGSGVALGSPGGSGTDAGFNANSQPTVTPIALPMNGHFGAVVVGDALDSRFPEATHLWGDRIAYTAYLHVGLAKSWLMQYSLPSSADTGAGSVARLEAPWPYDIVRPNIDPGSVDAEAILIHGLVNQSGRFESLSVVFPTDLQRAQFVLSALSQWQFRPASQDGQPTAVEVLLIIPESME
jgi:hypothetical protein